MTEIAITEFTDPGCPFAFSAEPFKWRIQWLYQGHIDWQVRMVGLSQSPDDYERKGFTVDKQAKSTENLSRKYGMPMLLKTKDRMAATVPACRAVVATRINRHEAAGRLLRQLRVLNFTGHHLDDQSTLDAAADATGIDVEVLNGWLREPSTETELRADMDAARTPSSAALALEHKLANWPGGKRYTCPSYLIARENDGAILDIPGFQPIEVYEVALANLFPEIERRSDPTVSEALTFTGVPTATKEISVLCGISVEEAERELAKIANEQRVGLSSYWSL